MKNSHHAVLLAAVFSSYSLSAGPAGSCNNTTSGFCNEFTGSSYKTTNVEKSCKKQKMEFLTGSCPTEGLVGSCLVYGGKNNESLYSYYKKFPGYGIKPKAGVASAAEKQCNQLNGRWTLN